MRIAVEQFDGLPRGRDLADLAASFQRAVADVVADRARNALGMAAERGVAPTALVVAGGVAANAEIRARLAAVGAERGLPLRAPPLALCTDNAAMIAWAGVERLARGESDALDAPARPRWPLDPRAA
jgi:N6-L-threonylcarbamoyladenine synthase